MDIKKSLVKNVIYKSLLSLFNIIIPILIGSYALRVIGKDHMGQIYYADSLYQYFLIFASFGIYNYGLREVSRIRKDDEKIKSLFSSLFIIGLISNILVLLVYIAFIFLNFKGNEKFILLNIYMFSLFSNIFYVEWINEALEKYDFITIKTIVVKIIYIIALFTLVKSEKDYLIYAGILSISIFLNNIISFYFIFKNIGFTKKSLSFKKHTKFLIMAFIMANAGVLYTQLDIVFLGSYVSDEAVSFYAAPKNLVHMIYVFIMSVVYVTVPRLSNILEANDEENYTRLLDKTTRILSLFLFPAMIGIYILSEEIILIYSGTQYIPAIPVLRIFSIYMISLVMESVLSNQVMYVKRHEKKLIVFIFIYGAINLMVKLILVHFNKLTPESAIISTTMANFLLGITEYFYSRKKLGLNLKLLDMKKMKYFIVALGFLPISIIVRKSVTSTISLTLLIMILCSLYYFITLYILKDDILFSIINKVMKRNKEHIK
ncbi:oligosaccharide flippase family protein [Clostridium sp.]|uniref:oligosaccharide flippase family protein n=1 Tax=Clostridium sp. TaxID=1506 RepID=UPI003463E39D